MTPLVVMVAPSGARRTRDDHPNLPLTPAELAYEAALCAEAGATILHLHVRDREGRHSLDPTLYRAATEAIREAVGARIVVQITTEAVGRYSPEQQMKVVRQAHPEAVSLGLRELVPDDRNPGEAAAFLFWLKREQIAPQYILYSPADVAKFHSLHRRGVIPQERPFALFVLGRHVKPAEVRPRDILSWLKAHEAHCPWALCAFGRIETACVLTAAGLGGHIRVGFENNLWLADGRLAERNADLVRQACGAAPLLGRPVADIDAARSFLADTAR